MTWLRRASRWYQRAIALLLALVSCSSARAEEGRAVAIDALSVRGAKRTRASTIRSLLPRDPPATFSMGELRELERRLNNLGIFDAVTVRVEGRQLLVDVREKWTLIPTVALATGRTLTDTYASLGATEYNLAGAADQIGGFVSWEQRGLNGALGWTEHPYDPRSGGFFAEIYYVSSSLRFDSGEAWYRDQAGGTAGWQVPYAYCAPLRVRARAYGYDERISDREGGADPPSGVAFGSYLEMSWDRYTWRDLAPEGFDVTLELSAGAFVPAAEPRHQGLLRGTFALSPTSTTSLVGQVVGEAASPGNVNHSLLLGGLRGVRGLADSFYRTQAQSFTNLELRHAWRFAERWALQGAVFGDGAVFSTMDARGRGQRTEWAASSGAGLRLIPTFLAEIVLRVDAGRLFTPEKRWFVQAALAQYF
jgi:hypothetical protein